MLESFYDYEFGKLNKHYEIPNDLSYKYLSHVANKEHKERKITFYAISEDQEMKTVFE